MGWIPAHVAHLDPLDRQLKAVWPHDRQVEHCRATAALVHSRQRLTAPAKLTEVNKRERATEAFRTSLTLTRSVAVIGAEAPLGSTKRGSSVNSASFQAGFARRARFTCSMVKGLPVGRYRGTAVNLRVEVVGRSTVLMESLAIASRLQTVSLTRTRASGESGALKRTVRWRRRPVETSRTRCDKRIARF